MLVRIVALVGMAVVFGAWGSPAAHSATPAQSYCFMLRHSSKFLVPAVQIDAVAQNPSTFNGSLVDLSGTVAGVVSTDGGRTALVNSQSQSYAIQIGSQFSNAPWIASGQPLRLLVRVQKPAGNGGTWLRLVSAAPSVDVAAIEASQSTLSRLDMNRSRSLTSRSLGYRTRAAAMEASDLAFANGGGGPIAPLSPAAAHVYPSYRAAIHGMNPSLPDAQLDKITTSILYFSSQNNLDPRLVIAMIIAESGFNMRSTSRTGAMGLGQLMPSTARGLGVTNAYDPVQNIGAAVHILRGHLDSYGGAPIDGSTIIPTNQIALMMAAYNAGPGAVRRYHGVPPYRETQRYVQRVTSLYHQMCGIAS